MSATATSRSAAFAVFGLALGAAHFAALAMQSRAPDRGRAGWLPAALPLLALRAHRRRLVLCRDRRAPRALLAAAAGFSRRALFALRLGRPCMTSPLSPRSCFISGPVPVTGPVVTTWVDHGGADAAALRWRRGGWRSLPARLADRARNERSRLFENQIRDTMRAEPGRYLPLIATLFLYILAANWSSIIPGRRAADRPSRNRCGAGRDRLSRRDLFGVRARGPGAISRPSPSRRSSWRRSISPNPSPASFR